MRVVFSGNPSQHRLQPMFPLLAAAAAAGHDVAVLSDRSLLPVVLDALAVPVTALSGGPSARTVLDEVEHRWATSGISGGTASALGIARFAEARIDLALEDALTSVRAQEPDVVVSEGTDGVGPLVAGTVGVPLVRHASDAVQSQDVAESLAEAVRRGGAARGITVPDALCSVDITPPVFNQLVRLEPCFSMDRGAGRTPTTSLWRNPLTDGADFRWDVLVALPDSAAARPAVLTEALASIDLRQANVVVATQPGSGPVEHLTGPNVTVTTRPVRDLFDDMDVVVTDADRDVVIAALTAGVPVVALPSTPEQDGTAMAVAAAGAGVVVSDTAAIGDAVRLVALSRRYRVGARDVSADMWAMSTPSAVWRSVERALLPARGAAS